MCGLTEVMSLVDYNTGVLFRSMSVVLLMSEPQAQESNSYSTTTNFYSFGSLPTMSPDTKQTFAVDGTYDVCYKTASHQKKLNLY